MNVYRIKVTSDRMLRKSDKELEQMLDLKLFKNKDFKKGMRESNQPLIANNQLSPLKTKTEKETKQGIRADDYKGFILNRYNAHRLMEYLHSDVKKSIHPQENADGLYKKNAGLKYSYTMTYKKGRRPFGYENCSSYDAYIILKTEHNIDKKIFEINKLYTNSFRNTRFKKMTEDSREKIQFIKKTKINFNYTDNLIFKKSSPVIIKSTVRQIEDKDFSTQFFHDIYQRNNIFEQVKSLYNYAENGTRDSKLVYFVPEGTENLLEKKGTPVLTLKKEDYLAMALNSIGISNPCNAAKHVRIKGTPKLSIMKVNKIRDSKLGKEEVFFNVFGAAFTLEMVDNDIFERINCNGLGHNTGFGFGFAFNEKKVEKKYENKGYYKKNSNSGVKPTNKSVTISSQKRNSLFDNL